MTRQLELIDMLMEKGKEEFTFEDAHAVLGGSPLATSGILNRLYNKGQIDRLARGHYSIRPLGSIGTSSVTDSLDQAIGSVFSSRVHRIAYLTALSMHDLLNHPARTIFVACTQQIRIASISNRPLCVVIEKASTIHLETEKVGRSWISTPERAVFESALRVELVGGIERLAEAVSNASELDTTRIVVLAEAFGARGQAALRRLASLSYYLELPLQLVPRMDGHEPLVRLDPRDKSKEWVDGKFKVVWNTPLYDLRAVVGN